MNLAWYKSEKECMELFMELSPIAINTSCPFGRKYFQDPTYQRSKQHLPNNSPLHSLHIFLTCQVNKEVHFLLINIVLPLGMIGILYLHKSHNTPRLPPKNLYRHCFRLLLRHVHVPGEIANNEYAKFLGD